MKLLTLVFFCLLPVSSMAHHVLGRPSYSLGEDSNTPPSMQVETQIGEYYVTYMAFPAFPKPNEPGRLNLYAKRIDNGKSFPGQVTFKVLDDNWFSSKEELLGTQAPDDSVFRQGFVFSKEGDYIIRAEFQDKEPYIIDFPLRIGEPSAIGPLGLTVGLIVVILISVNLTQRRRMQRLQAGRHHAENQHNSP
ncbi:MAG: hypothetical protein OEZ39_18835 [Gammaproteobacteria bacterium]|nr:hypothetical protein [Gammaproteobacteria bacterium]MDH5653921.1 hypothetical protein [Gammaproteobacteria bacterium]